ncbi:MAG TPA: glycosyltransferase family 2 protein [Pyrinomonadaceae bacterium]|nr:glycosyltransferase family 2 protein [Pyrinomonadaceae bacterium]
MKISVAMCTYNGARYIKDQLQSIARQTRLPDELVISDDASMDGTEHILDEFSKTARFPVRLSVNRKNQGVIRNFEQAICLCDGDVIALSDCDDVWETRKLELLERSLLQNPEVGLIFTDAEIVDASSKPINLRLSQSVGLDRQKQRKIRSGRALDVLLARTVVTGATMAFRSEFRDIILPLPAGGPFYHDGWIALVMAPVSAFLFIEESTIKYRAHSGQCVGIEQVPKLQSVMRTRKTSKSFYFAQAEQFQEAYERLKATRRTFTDQSALLKLQDKISHLQARATMPERRLSRVRAIGKELVNLHYHRFSRGWFSAAKDLLA